MCLFSRIVSGWKHELNRIIGLTHFDFPRRNLLRISWGFFSRNLVMSNETCKDSFTNIYFRCSLLTVKFVVLSIMFTCPCFGIFLYLFTFSTVDLHFQYETYGTVYKRRLQFTIIFFLTIHRTFSTRSWGSVRKYCKFWKIYKYFKDISTVW